MHRELGGLVLLCTLVTVGLLLGGCGGNETEPTPVAQDQQSNRIEPATTTNDQPIDEPEPVCYPPVAAISYQPDVVLEGDTVTFADISTDRDDDIVSRRWVLDGAEVSTQMSFEWVAEAGVVEVDLFVTDATGNEDFDIEVLHVGYRGESDVRITHIFYDGLELRAEGDEYVQITNQGDAPQDLSRWTLRDKHDQGQSYTFGSSRCPGSSKTTMAPGESIRVYTDECHEESGNHSFGRGSAVWSNNGDTAQLVDSEGNVVDEYSYGDGGE